MKYRKWSDFRGWGRLLRGLPPALAVPTLAALAGDPASARQDDYPAAAAGAGRLTIDVPAEGQLERRRDVDWFAVDLQAGVAYAVDQEGADTRQGTLADPRLTLLDARGNPIGGDDDGGTGLNARLLFTPERSGRYFVAAGAFGDATGTYRVTVFEYAGFADDVGGTPRDAAAIDIGTTTEGVLEVPGDSDFYAVTLTAGVLYAIDLEGQPTGRGTLPDPLMALLDAGGRFVAGNDDGGQGLNARLMFTPDRTERYFIEAAGFSTSAGSYTLTVGELPAPPGK
jgi:hypothetical protein